MMQLNVRVTCMQYDIADDDGIPLAANALFDQNLVPTADQRCPCSVYFVLLPPVHSYMNLSAAVGESNRMAPDHESNQWF
jgi:hypothetical protein